MPDEHLGTAILTLKEVSAYLKVTERTIYRLVAGKKMPAFKVGGSWRFKKADIDQWISHQSENVAAAEGTADLGERK
ncbi:methylation-associated defense system helix-turn-helix domain-containing protein MAD1 [Ralstonia solanacearum]|uniref:methylation-associated defense system helix-turn-helix domain-containing protein MAD1 n=1 Tax=Ralstonia solanacearum TaxID=305 RepID=UPI00168B5F48|nr:helix-turn-helix domain-containing protein [Ralstonia solanacearum]QNT25247.1 helix-turn-helix domain-containing protein [Ralstonia solanacearum]QNT62891.1 helix-turn-helix domain-containing protein [Ralstonia solanacearum]